HNLSADRGELAALGPGPRPQLLVRGARRYALRAYEDSLSLLYHLPRFQCALQLAGQFGLPLSLDDAGDEKRREIGEGEQRQLVGWRPRTTTLRQHGHDADRILVVRQRAREYGPDLAANCGLAEP